MNEFNEMTNAQLKEACADFGLVVEAKTPGKPNKTELLAVLAEFKAKQDALHGKEDEPEVEVASTKPTVKKRSKDQLMRLDLFMKERVIVHDQQENQTKDEMISISWGNRMIGGQTDWVDLSGEPQYIRRGAINNLKEASMIAHTSKKGGGANQVRKKRFIVVPTEPLTEIEFEDLKAQQKMRNSKIA